MNCCRGPTPPRRTSRPWPENTAYHRSAYLRDLYQTDGIAETVNMAHIKGHYYESHRTINPTGIAPLGPTLDLDAPHGRGQLESCK